MHQSRGALAVYDMLCPTHQRDFNRAVLTFMNRHGNQARRANDAVGRAPRGSRSDDQALAEALRSSRL